MTDCDMADAVLFADQAIEGRGYLDERELNLARCFKSLRSALEAERAEVELQQGTVKELSGMCAAYANRARTLAEALRLCMAWLNGMRDPAYPIIEFPEQQIMAALPSVAEQPEDKET